MDIRATCKARSKTHLDLPGAHIADPILREIGFRQANRGEYTFRAYINGKTDLTKAEAVKEIIDSHTDAGRSHAVGRLSGSLFEEIDSIKKLIVDTLAAIEVEIEYPEDEETIADTFDRKDIELEVDGTDYLVLKDQAKHCNWDFYSRAWDKMCDKICAQYGLPKNWYIYHIRFSY